MLLHLFSIDSAPLFFRKLLLKICTYLVVLWSVRLKSFLFAGIFQVKGSFCLFFRIESELLEEKVKLSSELTGNIKNFMFKKTQIYPSRKLTLSRTWSSN